MKSRRAQVFSMDLIIAVVLFITSFAALYGFITYLLVEPEEQSLSREGQVVATAIAAQGSKVQFVDAQQINVTKLEDLSEKTYDEIKGELGTHHNFCLYIEDEEGKLVTLSNGKKSLGNKDAMLKIEGQAEPVPCGG